MQTNRNHVVINMIGIYKTKQKRERRSKDTLETNVYNLRSEHCSRLVQGAVHCGTSHR